MGDNSQEIVTLEYDLPIVIIDDDSTVVNDESTTAPRGGNDNSNVNRDKTFNAKVEDYKNDLSLSMREKSMISYPYASTIIKALKHELAEKKVGIDCKFHA
ncbi:unnamed protein product [Didymodactylos carnosus]|uniref:Uncharacterized protein n=1 Tax=Didymodactylos carnosus TaxID=1234261 RepID=A0A813WKK7_9BILA|nr:unnamed protein product [Didymodactylos carnosus]CAF1020691.1 unnamed protein product [Didymodactylos carnosus]CAF3642759.1 unnamed protein product [Didymodactylos carnosus]CAF3789402.1 unnamed protein product [Didymodactylos carnosus]